MLTGSARRQSIVNRLTPGVRGGAILGAAVGAQSFFLVLMTVRSPLTGLQLARDMAFITLAIFICAAIGSLLGALPGLAACFSEGYFSDQAFRRATGLMLALAIGLSFISHTVWPGVIIAIAALASRPRRMATHPPSAAMDRLRTPCETGRSRLLSP